MFIVTQHVEKIGWEYRDRKAAISCFSCENFSHFPTLQVIITGQGDIAAVPHDTPHPVLNRETKEFLFKLEARKGHIYCSTDMRIPIQKGKTLLWLLLWPTLPTY